MTGSYNYNDLQKQFKMIKRMGSLSRIMGFIPGMGKYKDQLSNVDDKQLNRIEALIQSMTPEERREPSLIEKSSRRRQRVARGLGCK